MEGAITSNPTCRSTQAFLQDEVLYIDMLQMDEILRLRADPASPWTPETLDACAQRFGACVGRVIEVCSMCWPDCRELLYTEFCRIRNRLEFDVETKAESEAESEGDADI